MQALKIVFLCGSLELGRDGVGDYVIRLSIELARKGHHIVAIALNDHYINESYVGNEIAEGANLKIVRLPSIWSFNDRFDHAKHWVNKSNPDWLSLQFVPFAFHEKGLPFSLTNQLLKLGFKRKWHVMFHELWVGMNEESSFKYIVWGKVQRYLIKSLITKLKPQVVHTQTALYQTYLERMHYKCSLLPLFSNIPNSGEYDYNSLPERHSKQDIKLVAFGYIHPRAQIEMLAKDASLYAAQHLCSVTLILAGRSGPELDYWARSWQAVGLPVSITGEQSPEAISDILRSATLGLTTTPLALIGKSGTVAAMREHRLLVLCVANPWTALGVDNPLAPPDVFSYEYGRFASYLRERPCQSSHSTLSAVAQQFIDSLAAFNGVK